jgi:hypothetical protein
MSEPNAESSMPSAGVVWTPKPAHVVWVLAAFGVLFFLPVAMPVWLQGGGFSRGVLSGARSSFALLTLFTMPVVLAWGLRKLSCPDWVKALGFSACYVVMLWLMQGMAMDHYAHYRPKSLAWFCFYFGIWGLVGGVVLRHGLKGGSRRGGKPVP